MRNYDTPATVAERIAERWLIASVGMRDLIAERNAAARPLRICQIPGTSGYDMHAAGVLCHSCQAIEDAWEAEEEWNAKTPAERIAVRWSAARRRINDRVETDAWACPF